MSLAFVPSESSVFGFFSVDPVPILAPDFRKVRRENMNYEQRIEIQIMATKRTNTSKIANLFAKWLSEERACTSEDNLCVRSESTTKYMRCLFQVKAENTLFTNDYCGRSRPSKTLVQVIIGTSSNMIMIEILTSYRTSFQKFNTL